MTTVRSVSASGYIAYNEDNYRYKTDFEDVTPVYPNALTIEPLHSVNTQPIPYSKLPEDWLRAAWYDLTTLPPGGAYSGSRCLYFRLSDVTANRRIQLNIGNEGYFDREVATSAVYYLPADWHMEGESGYYVFWQTFPKEYTQGYSIRLNIWGGRWALACRRQSDNAIMWSEGSASTPPLGRWFSLTVYLERDNSNGVVKIWVDGELIFDKQGVRTASPEGYFYISVLSIYHDPTDYDTHEIWMDDLVIHDSMPEP